MLQYTSGPAGRRVAEAGHRTKPESLAFFGGKTRVVVFSEVRAHRGVEPNGSDRVMSVLCFWRH